MTTLPDWFLRDPAPAPGVPLLEIAALWGDWLLDVRHLPLDGTLQIGDGGLPGPLDGVLIDAGELCVPHGCTAQVQVGDGWGPWTGGPLEAGARIVVRTAAFSWLVRVVPPGTLLPGAHAPKRELGLLAAVGVNGCLALLLWVFAITAPPPPQVTVEELSDQFAEVMLQQPPEEKRVVAVNKPIAPEERHEGQRAEGLEGHRGTTDGRLKRALEQRRSDRQVADGAGFMDALASAGEFGEMFSATGLGGGVVDALGRSSGPKGQQFGTGLGWRGQGPGGGGAVAGLPGGTGTRGRGGDGSSLVGGGPSGPKETGSIATGDDVIRIGGMDRALIDQVVKQHLQQFRYCYQRELQKDPSLGGKITVKWIISSDGSVSSASVKHDGIGNAAVSRCMTNVTRRMTFPQPKGGIVIVSYPFLFAPG